MDREKHPSELTSLLWAIPPTAIVIAVAAALLAYPTPPRSIMQLAYQNDCVFEVLPRIGLQQLKIGGAIFCRAAKAGSGTTSSEEVVREIRAAIAKRRQECIERVEAFPPPVRWLGQAVGPALSPEWVCGRPADQDKITGP